MAASAEEIEEWIERGREMGASSIISVCDTFDHTDYPVFVMPEEDLEERRRAYDGPNMQRVNEVIEVLDEVEESYVIPAAVFIARYKDVILAKTQSDQTLSDLMACGECIFSIDDILDSLSFVDGSIIGLRGKKIKPENCKITYYEK